MGFEVSFRHHLIRYSVDSVKYQRTSIPEITSNLVPNVAAVGKVLALPRVDTEPSERPFGPSLDRDQSDCYRCVARDPASASESTERSRECFSPLRKSRARSRESPSHLARRVSSLRSLKLLKYQVPRRFPEPGIDRWNHWTTLLAETGYPGVKAGDGQILTFAPASARRVRVYATKLGGAGSESGYRMQLTDMQVFG